MKHFILVVMMIILCALSAQAGDVGVSISVGQPGFYGHIDIGNAPQPELIYPQPIVIQPPRGYVPAEPLYLHVPPGHEKHWRKHCHEYNACGRPVYFVRDSWYNKVYVPHYRQHHKYYEGRRGEKSEHGKDNHGHGRGHHGDD
jgi:hypothetical protein